MNPLPSAFLRPEIMALGIPILALMIPIVAILTAHQRKMAELYHSRHQGVSQQDVDSLRREIAELRERVNQQAIALDSVGRLAAPPVIPTTPPNIEQRLNS
jgi:uncharacterized protein YlxW (UPF0749 family)